MGLKREDGMRRMLDDIRAEINYTQQLTGKAAFSKDVMEAMAAVPREQFVPDDLRPAAFNDGPLPIGYGQTISQPFIVALMTELLLLAPEDKVLEIGTGSGYQTAVLSRLCQSVYSMDVVPELVDTTAVRLKKLGYENVNVRVGNGYHGWPEHAPYDAIIVTAAAPYIPERLIEQLKPGGKLVIPVGQQFMAQQLICIDKDLDGSVHERSVLRVSFVPLVRRP
jgi:protein-L-isoaspartate(D-aspartate) O-methyltransferase